MAMEFLKAGCNVTLSGRGETLSQAADAELSSFRESTSYAFRKKAVQNLWDTSLSSGAKWIYGSTMPDKTCLLVCWETGEAH